MLVIDDTEVVPFPMVFDPTFSDTKYPLPPTGMPIMTNDASGIAIMSMYPNPPGLVVVDDKGICAISATSVVPPVPVAYPALSPNDMTLPDESNNSPCVDTPESLTDIFSMSYRF